MTKSHLLKLAADPTLIKGVHEACDLWCMYCNLTARCLAFRCSGAAPDIGVWDAGTESGDRTLDGMMFVKMLAEVEGRAVPPEIEAILSNDRERQRRVFTLADPLERIGGSYMNLAETYLHSRPDFPFAITQRPSGPTPLEVFAWYHVLAPARIFRALLSAAEAATGVAGRHDDALRAAKVALIGIDRSLEALAALAATDEDPRLLLLQDCLRRLQCEVDRRFPQARAFVRRGLDDTAIPAAAGPPAE